MKYDRFFRLPGGPHRVTSDSLSSDPEYLDAARTPPAGWGRTPGWRCSCCSHWPAHVRRRRSSGRACPCRRPTSPFWGGVPTGTASPQPIGLSLYAALKSALAHNLGVLQCRRGRRARRRCAPARAERAAAERARQRQRGRAQDQPRSVRLSAAADPFPRVVGPFDVFDARVFLRQSVLDLRAMNAERAEGHRLAAARLSYRSARDLIVLVAANLYLEAVAAGARVEAAKAQLETARALHAQALDLRSAGTVAGIDVLRAEVRAQPRAAARPRPPPTPSRRRSCSWRG